MSEFIVAKYGGSSMAHPEQVAEVVENNPQQAIVVVSAPGVVEEGERKVTDLLESCYHAVNQDNATEAADLRNEIIYRFDRAYQDHLGEKKLRDLRDTLCTELTHWEETHYMERYLSIGELVSAEYFASLIGGRTPLGNVMFRGSKLDRGATLAEIRADLTVNDHRSRRVIVPGFFGHDEAHKIKLLGRGGSDRTGALYAAALGWDYDNYTDVPGIYSANPKVVANSRIIPELTRMEVREGAHGGSGVLQGDTIVDLNGSDVVTTVKSTFNSDAPGTRVLPTREVDENNPIVAVSGRRLMEVSVEDLGMANETGYLSRVLDAAAENDISIEHVPTAQDALSVTIHESVEKEKLERFVDAVREQTISHGAKVELSSKGVVYVVGEALRGRPIKTQCIGEIATHLHRAGIPIDDLVSHTTSPSLAVLTDPDRVDDTIALLHQEFIEK